MKKRFFTALVVMLLACTFVFAETNNQKIYGIDSEVYKNISDIYIASGLARPSTAAPWSGDELLKMLDKIDYNNLNSYLKGLYLDVVEELNQEDCINFKNGATNFDLIADLEGYIHTNTEGPSRQAEKDLDLQEKAFGNREWWYGKDLTKVDPLLELDWETYYGKNFYTFFNATLQNSVHGKQELGATKINTNIPFLQNLSFDMGLIDINFPTRAFAAFGGDGWSVEIGRDNINWGNGTVSNMAISDSFPYQNAARFTTYSEKMKYSYLLAFYPNKMNYYEGGQYKGYALSDYHRQDGITFYAAHRFEARLFKEKLNFALTEALMYTHEGGDISFAAISPMYFMHNAYIPLNSNSTLVFEFDWATPVKGLDVYGQVLLDQFKMPGFESDSVAPDGIGLLAGATFKTTAGEGLLTINPEVAYVSKYAYVRDFSENYGLDYVGAVRNRTYSFINDAAFDDYVIGYKYGPDCMTGNININYKSNGLELDANVFAMLHGVNDRWSVWTETNKDDYENPANYKYNDTEKRNSKWITFDFGLGAKYNVTEDLQVSADADFVLMKNIFNYEGNNANDIQLIIGAKYNLF